MAFDPITGLLNFGTSLIDRLIPDATANAKAKADLLQLQVQGELQQIAGQMEINKAEAASPSVFVAGWRPFVGWIGGFAFGYATILEPLLRFTAQVGFHYGGSFPVINSDLTMQILFGLLGLGGLRTYEKMQGVETTSTRKR